MYKDLENGFDDFMKNFENIPAQNVIYELEELGVTFVPTKSAKSNYEEKQLEINRQA